MTNEAGTEFGENTYGGKIMRYCLIRETDADKLNETINEHLAIGWELYGFPLVVPSEVPKCLQDRYEDHRVNVTTEYVQAIVKRGEND